MEEKKQERLIKAKFLVVKPEPLSHIPVDRRVNISELALHRYTGTSIYQIRVEGVCLMEMVRSIVPEYKEQALWLRPGFDWVLAKDEGTGMQILIPLTKEKKGMDV